jgi:STE24 endopeptidase
MNSFTALFLAMLGVRLAAEVWLALRQLRHVAAHRRQVPAPFRGQVTLAAHRKAARYTEARTRLGLAEALYETLLLLGWTIGGGAELLDRAWRAGGFGPLATGVGFLLSALAIQAVLELPFAAWRQFVIERRFGFNRSTPALFASDFLKQMLVLLVLGAPLATALLWLMQETGALWWIYAWALWMAFAVCLLWAYPRLIAPLFNRFTPLPPGRLRERIQRLLKRMGFAAHDIYVMDSSKRTTHGNAYFTGLGRAKRIVFFDSLLERLNAAEIEAVLAHELGHFKLRHVLKRTLVMACLSLVGFALLSWFAREAWFYAGLGVSQPSAHTALLLFVFVAPLFAFFLQPLIAAASRRHEYEADRFAASVASARALASALVKLYRDNAATLTPDPVYSAFYDTHPPALRRIAALRGGR